MRGLQGLGWGEMMNLLGGKGSVEVGGGKRAMEAEKKPKRIIYMYEIIKQFKKIFSDGKYFKV